MEKGIWPANTTNRTIWLRAIYDIILGHNTLRIRDYRLVSATHDYDKLFALPQNYMPFF
jgi:hypothetical protein